MKIRESYRIDDILEYPDLAKPIFYFDFDNTLVKLDKNYQNHIGSDAWFASVFSHTIKTLKDISLAFERTTTVNDSVQNLIRLKAAEKKTIDVLKQLQLKKIPFVIATARGFTLAKRTQEQLQEAKITINHDWLKTNKKEPIELPLKFNFYTFDHLPEKIDKLDYKFSYIYIEQTHQLFYFNRFRKAQEIEINNPQFAYVLDEILKVKNHKKLSKEEINLLLNDNHQHEKHVVIFHEGIIYCEGQNKGDAIEAFSEWVRVNADLNLNEEYDTFMVDDKKNNIDDVEAVMKQSGQNFFGIHYKRVIENFDLEASREELKNLYPHLPVKTRVAMVEIKLSENAMGFWHKKHNVQSAEDLFVNQNILKTSTPQLR